MNDNESRLAPSSTSGLWTAVQSAQHFAMSKPWLYKQAELGMLPWAHLGAQMSSPPEEEVLAAKRLAFGTSS